MKQQYGRPMQNNTVQYNGVLSISETDGTKFLNSNFVELQAGIAESGQKAIQELTSRGMLNFRIPSGFTAEQVATAVEKVLVSAGASFGVMRTEKNAGKRWLVSKNGTFIKFFVTSSEKEQMKQANADAIRALLA